MNASTIRPSMPQHSLRRQASAMLLRRASISRLVRGEQRKQHCRVRIGKGVPSNGAV